LVLISGKPQISCGAFRTGQVPRTIVALAMDNNALACWPGAAERLH